MSENVYGADQRHVRPRLHEGEIVEVEGGHIIRSVGRKDRHSKVYTAKGPRDRRVRLSALTAIQFYDVQDRLGYDRPSKAVDWLIKNAKSAIDELYQLNPSSSKRYQAQSSSPRDDHHQFQFSKDQTAMNSRAFARDRARERAKERNSITNSPTTDHTTNNFSKFPQQHQQQPGDHNFHNAYDQQPNNVLLHQSDNNNNNDDDNSNSDQRNGSTKAQSLNPISARDHQHNGDPAMQANNDQMMSSIQSYLNLPNALINQAADLRLSLMQRPSVQYLSLLQNPNTTNYRDMLSIRPAPSHQRVMRPVQALSASSGFDPLTLSHHHHHQYPGFGISSDHRRYNNYDNNSSNNIVLQSDHHHYDEPGLHRHQYNFFTSGSHINPAALHASAVENHDDQKSGYATTIAFPAVRGTLQSINSTAPAPACARPIPASVSVINRSNINGAADNNIEHHHDHGCNSIEETAGAFPALIHGFPDDHECHDQDDMKPSTC